MTLAELRDLSHGELVQHCWSVQRQLECAETLLARDDLEHALPEKDVTAKDTDFWYRAYCRMVQQNARLQDKLMKGGCRGICDPRMAPHYLTDEERVLYEKIVAALWDTKGNKTVASKMLGMNRTAMLYYCTKWNIPNMGKRNGPDGRSNRQDRAKGFPVCSQTNDGSTT